MTASVACVPRTGVTGFPGYGKTTLIRHILRPLPAGIGNLRPNHLTRTIKIVSTTHDRIEPKA